MSYLEIGRSFQVRIAEIIEISISGKSFSAVEENKHFSLSEPYLEALFGDLHLGDCMKRKLETKTENQAL